MKRQRIFRKLKIVMKNNAIDETQFVNKCARKFYIDQQEIIDKYTTYSSNNYQKLLERINVNSMTINAVFVVLKFEVHFKTYEEAKK